MIKTILSALVALALFWSVNSADVTFFGLSDTHYGVGPNDSAKTAVILRMNALPGAAWPASIGGVVDTPAGVIMNGDLVDNGTIAAQWDNWIRDFGVNGEGLCKWPVYEGYGNHDGSQNIRDAVKARNLLRKNIAAISSNGYHYAWVWDSVLFIQLNVCPGNRWWGETDTYGPGAHDPAYARDFLKKVLEEQAGNSGRPVVVCQHFRPIDDNWWTYAAADKYYQVLQDYNIIFITVGHQGGGVNNLWRGINWISSNGDLDVYRISPDKLHVAIRTEAGWGQTFQKTIFSSWATSGLAAVINNGYWATDITATTATLSGKLVYDAGLPTQATVCWDTVDRGATRANWKNSKDLGAKTVGAAFSTGVTGLLPWTNYYYRCFATNSRGTVCAAASIPFFSRGILPAGWQTKFIGFEQRFGGGANCTGGTFEVRGSGRDFAEPGQPIDNFQYAYTGLNGDGEIQARIATMVANSREPKAGVMLRETAGDSSRNAAVWLSSANGIRFSSRSTLGGSSTTSATNTIKAPYWVRLVRSGNTFTGYMSADGAAWIQVGLPVTISMPSNLLAGLAVTAGNRDGSRVHSSMFDNVTVTGNVGVVAPARPQPVSGTVTLRILGTAIQVPAGIGAFKTVQFFSGSGVKVRDLAFTGIRTPLENSGTLPAGLYLLRVTGTSGSCMIKALVR